LTLSERVRESLAAEMSADHGSAHPLSSVEGRKGAVGSGLIGAGLAAAAALVVALNLTPVDDAARDSRFAAGGPSLIDANTNRIAATLSEHEHEHKANVAPARMTRYLVSHAEYSNAASRQFVDSHLVMPSFRGPSWQSQRSIE
jgi:hypothetical protein